MIKVITYLIAASFGYSTFGQVLNLDSIFEPKLSGELFQKKTGTIGKQFFCDSWCKSDIKLSTGQWVFNKTLNYNMLIDEIIWFQKDSLRQIKLEKYFIDEVYFKQDKGDPIRFKRIRTKLSDMNDSSDIFVQVLCEKKASLFVFRHVKVGDHITKIEKGISYSYDKLVAQPFYFLKLPNGKTITLKRIRRHLLLKTLPVNDRTAINEIIHLYRLSVKTENDLSKLVSLIN